MISVLPHRYPFLFVERVERDADGEPVAVVGLSSGAMSRGRPGAAFPDMLALEILAQSSLVLDAHGDDEPPQRTEPGLLAGIDGADFSAELARRPLAAGDRLHARCELLGSFGRLKKVRGRLSRDGAEIVEAVLLLAG